MHYAATLPACMPACLPAATDPARFEEATYRTTRWLDRCIKANRNPDKQNLFPIVQGGFDVQLRDTSMQQVGAAWRLTAVSSHCLLMPRAACATGAVGWLLIGLNDSLDPTTVCRQLSWGGLTPHTRA